ncbi:FRG domain-containing protein [Teredinibacter franksiae]|uniref:FRG domain-containing protein n=1 Tax=Teredinibacter franksiae TaxID=2761453 RepID=UPI001624886E|nr:FRG domain-containing protein [Teredinibacter franksiae]
METRKIKYWPKKNLITDGYTEVYFESWAKFSEYLNTNMLDQNSCIWRGQREQNWKLESAFDRSSKVNGSSSVFEEQDKRFRYACSGKLAAEELRKIEDPRELWALGQHHGLHTPLLDWTESPYVAAFFAFADQDATKGANEYRAVYCFYKQHAEIIESVRFESIRGELARGSNPLKSLAYQFENQDHLTFYRPDISDNSRLISQSGLFSISIGSIEDWVTRNSKGEDSIAYLQKLLIPESERISALKALNRMNINFSTLYPDLEGASKHTNLYMEIENY